MTLGQGHQKVIQHISQTYILCPKYLRISSNGFDVRSKSHCGGGGRGSGNERKTDWGDSIKWNFRHVIFKQILVIDGWGISCEIGLIWMSLDFIDDQSTLVQVMTWSRQATSHYLSQCWPRSLSPYGITRPQRVKLQIQLNPVILQLNFSQQTPHSSLVRTRYGVGFFVSFKFLSHPLA